MPHKVLRLPAVMDRTGLGSSFIYLLIQRGEFPKPIKIGVRAVAWIEPEGDFWIEERLEERGGVMMHEEQKKNPGAVTTRTGQNNRNSQTVDTENIARLSFDEQLSELAKMLRALLDLIEEDPDFEVIERRGFASVPNDSLKGGAV